MAQAYAAPSQAPQAKPHAVAPTGTPPAAQAGPAKPKRVAQVVKMKDGREVEFVGKRRMLKESIIEGNKVSVRLDFVNGETRLFALPTALMLRFAGHGAEQKLGDETAGEEKIEDMILAVDDLITQLNKGEWGAVREAGGFSGASIVIRAIMEASGKSQDDVKAFLQKKLDTTEGLTRKKLYDSFRNPNSKVGKIIERLEREERAKSAVLDADAELAAFVK